MIGDLIKALQAGRALSDPAKWKKGHWLTTTVGALVAGAIEFLKWKFPDIPLPEGIAEYSTEVIAGVLVVINLYLIPATTEKFGTKQKDK